MKTPQDPEAAETVQTGGDQAVAQERLVSREAMLALGFTETWPGGNPTEPWWENPFEMPGVWFTELPTVDHFWQEITRCFVSKGKSEIREKLKQTIFG
jgi:hypothetical protein